MSDSQFLQDLIAAVRARRHADTVIRNGQQDMHDIKITTTSDIWPKEKLSPLASDSMALLREGIEADDRSLHYQLSYRDACFPRAKDLLNTGDGIESAARFSCGIDLVRSAFHEVSRYEPSLKAIRTELPNLESCDPRYPIDYIILRGTQDSNGASQWQGFNYIDNMVAQACVMGTRIPTSTLPNDAVLGSEMAVLLLLLSSSHAQSVPIAAVISFTNTHARVIQACVVQKEEGPRVLIYIRYNAAVTPDGQKIWMKMLRWGLWSCEKDHVSAAEGKIAVNKSTKLAYRDVKLLGQEKKISA